MKLREILFGLAAIVLAILAHDVFLPALDAAMQYVGAEPAMPGVTVGAFMSLTGLKNISEQEPNPPGIRRLFVVLAADLLDSVIDWPSVQDVNDSCTVTVAIPLKVGKTLAVVQPADNSCEVTSENQGDRYYMSYKNGLMFDVAGSEAAQKAEGKKFLNAGAIFIAEQHDGQMLVIGTKLNPIVVKRKFATGKKGGDKKGYSFSGDNDSYMFEPPIYGSTLALPLPA